MTNKPTKKAPRRTWMPKPWPYPGDSREDKAKRVAISYRQLVFDISQGRCDDPAGDLHRLDRQWAEYGIRWPNPPAQPLSESDLDEWMNAADLANLIHRAPADIYRWARRGNIRQRVSADGSPEYSVESVVEYQRQQRQRRATRT